MQLLVSEGLHTHTLALRPQPVSQQFSQLDSTFTHLSSKARLSFTTSG